MASDDGWKDLNDMPDDLRILFLEGYCQVPWMETSFVRCPPIGGVTRPFRPSKIFRVWCSDPSYLGENEVKPDAYGVKRCQDEIRSGRYHAIVVLDYSNPEEREEFEDAFGDLLQQFVEAGGVVAFPSSEGMLVHTLEKYFGVEWQMADYYRTTWGPCMENEQNINYSFGNGNLSRRVIKNYSAKGTSLRGVPEKERCFGVTEDSRTQSLVPMMNGEDKSKSDDNGDYDVIVAMHDYGKGCVAYFGDVNAEQETIWLVAAFVESRAPKFPIDCFSRIEDGAFQEVIHLKDEGNDLFKAGELNQALDKYASALDKFGTKLGANGEQRDCYKALLSNMSLIHYKKEDYINSEDCASKVLDMEWGHEKCSYRRAIARLKISQSKSGGNIALLRKAKDDVLNAGKTPPATMKATQKLMAQIEAEIKNLKKTERKNFSKGFENALFGQL